MTVRVERTFEIDAPPERVWEFISDPEKRARSISVVQDYELANEQGTEATWHVRIPLPLIDRTATVDTEERERDPPNRVTFVGRSRVFDVEGEHVIEETPDGSRVRNRFVVDGRLPGVERFFRRNLDDELRNLEAAIKEDLR